MIYKVLSDIPEEYRFVIEKLINRGLIKVDDKNEFFLTREMLEIILIMIRAGLL